MRTKIVYVLVSQQTDYYYEMLQLSIYSLRLYHPNDVVEVVMDEDTYSRLEEVEAPILKDIVPNVVSVSDEYTLIQRSRYLKTRLRQIVKGDFLFIDTDTIVCESLSDIDNVEADVAMVADENTDHAYSHKPQRDLNDKAGFERKDSDPYYNSGVIFVRDSQQAMMLFDAWHTLWRQSLRNGVTQDQPALCQANADLGFPIRELSGVWNCQLFTPAGVGLINNSKVFHYWGSIKKDACARIEHLLRHIKNNGRITEAVAQVARNPRTTGYSLFTMSDERAFQFFYSDFLYIFDNVSPLYRCLRTLARLLLKPVQAVSRLKRGSGKR